MAQLHVRNVLHIDPTNTKLSLPLVLRPDARVGVVVDGAGHPRHTAEVTRAVHREEQVDHATLALALAVRRVQPLVAVLRAAPNLVLDAAVDIVLGVRLDHEEARVRRRQVELLRVVVVLDAELVEHGQRRRRGRGRRRRGGGLRARGGRRVRRGRVRVRPRGGRAGVRVRRVRGGRRRALLVRVRVRVRRRRERGGRQRRLRLRRGRRVRLRGGRRRRTLAAVPGADVHVVLAGHDGRRRHARPLLLEPAALRGRRRLGGLARYGSPRHLFGLRSAGGLLEVGHALFVHLVLGERERLHARVHRLDAVGHVQPFSSVVVVILLRTT